MSERCDRRAFLVRTAAASLALAGGHQACVGADAPTPIVDAHLHCFAGKASKEFPYHPRGPYQPEKASTPEHLLKCMQDADVSYAIVVHPEPYQDDHRYLEHCLTVGRGRLKGTCLFFADQADSLARMGELVKRQPGRIVAARIHAYAPDRLPPFEKPELKAFWKGVSDLGLALQLHLEPRYAPGFESLIREFPGTRVIVDHMGRPLQGTPAEHDVIVRWSRFENVIMKIAALPETRQYPHREIGPIIRKLTDAYGADRMIYGGGFGENATGADYRAYHERVRGYLPHLTAADQNKILGGTAARLFAFSK